MSTLNEFRLFPILPKELRLQIWGIALSAPRIVNIICDESIEIPSFAKSFTSSDPPPALLHVCRESRSEAFEIYKPLFQTKSSPKYTYVAFSQDIIRASDNLPKFLRSVELQGGIQKMTINIKDSHYFGHWGIGPLKKMQPNLRELELICEQGEMYDWGRDYGDLRTVTDDIRLEMAMDPFWDCPNMKIVDGRTGKIVEQILGGVREDSKDGSLYFRRVARELAGRKKIESGGRC
jgi:hypothetical protein